MMTVFVENVCWTKEAESSYAKIVDWIYKNWSQKEVNKLVQRTEKLISRLQRFPESCRPSIKRKDVRIAILDKHTQLIYHYNIKAKTITILLFWGMKQSPEKLKY